MKKRVFTVHVIWDDEAKVFVATSEDVPGLVTEADRWDRLVSKVESLVPILIRENDIDLETNEIPLNFLQSQHSFVHA